jgi:uncharacterized protein YdcH (DUF465 family)
MDNREKFSEQLARWERTHQALAIEVSELERRAFLTPEEQRRVSDLKKQKLAAKDRLFELKRFVG